MENSWLIEASSILPVWKIWQQKNTVEREKQRTQSNQKIQLRQYNKPIRPWNEWMQPAVKQSAIKRTWTSHDWLCFYYWLVEKKEPDCLTNYKRRNAKPAHLCKKISRLLCAKKKVNAYILIRHQRGSKDHSNIRYTHLIHGLKSYHSEKEIRLTVNTLL